MRSYSHTNSRISWPFCIIHDVMTHKLLQVGHDVQIRRRAVGGSTAGSWFELGINGALLIRKSAHVLVVTTFHFTSVNYIAEALTKMIDKSFSSGVFSWFRLLKIGKVCPVYYKTVTKRTSLLPHICPTKFLHNNWENSSSGWYKKAVLSQGNRAMPQLLFLI